MARLEELTEGTSVEGVATDGPVTVVHVKWFGDHAVELTYKLEHTGTVGNRLLYRSDEEKRLALEALSMKVWIEGDSITVEGVLPMPDVNTVLQPL